jgi:glycosyltransferase involved in cell wall biosynthesis
MPNRKKKILQLLQNCRNPILAVCNEYSRSLDRSKYHVTVVFLSGAMDQRVAEGTNADRVIFLELEKDEMRGLRLKAVKRIVQLCKEQEYDVVVCHRYKAAQVMSIVRMFCDISLIFYVVHVIGYMSRLKRKLYRYLVMRNHFQIIAVSEAVRYDLLKRQFRLSPSSVTTVHNTLNTEAVISEQLDRQKARQELNIDADDFVFGAVGRMVPFKNHETLIRAFALAHPKIREAKLVIIGEGRLERDLKQLTHKLDMTNHIIFSGVVPRAHSVMKAFDFLVLPSINEPFGMVLLEAMAAKVPIISSDTGGAPEIVGSFALMVPGNDPELYAETMVHGFSLSAEAREMLGLRGYQHLQSNFSASRFGEVLERFSKT